MNVLSVNVGLPRLVEYGGEHVATGIFKEAVAGKVRVNQLNLEGDGQADLRVHGGRYKSVYVYPSEHYELWRKELIGLELPWGVFGENLTTEGLTESDVRVGDRLMVGTAQFVVTQPRYPCFKLGIRFEHVRMEGRQLAEADGREAKPVGIGRGIDIIRRFAKSGRSGFYLAVEKTGELEAGDSIELSDGGDGGKTIAAIFRERVKGNEDE